MSMILFLIFELEALKWGLQICDVFSVPQVVAHQITRHSNRPSGNGKSERGQMRAVVAHKSI